MAFFARLRPNPLGILLASSRWRMQANNPDEAARRLIKRRVRFCINDVYVPEPAQVLIEIYGQECLQGTVIDFSDSGSAKNAFAVVAVDGLVQPVVLPAAKVHAIDNP